MVFKKIAETDILEKQNVWLTPQRNLIALPSRILNASCAKLVIDSGLTAGGTADIPSSSVLLFFNYCESMRIYSHMKNSEWNILSPLIHQFFIKLIWRRHREHLELTLHYAKKFSLNYQYHLLHNYGMIARYRGEFTCKCIESGFWCLYPLHSVEHTSVKHVYQALCLLQISGTTKHNLFPRGTHSERKKVYITTEFGKCYERSRNGLEKERGIRVL